MYFNNKLALDNLKESLQMPFAEQFQRCMKLPHDGDMIDKFLVQSIKISHHNIFDGVYNFPVEVVIIGDSGKQDVLKKFKPIFNKVISLFTEYGSLYQCRCEKLEINMIAPKTYKLTTTGIGYRIYPKQELEAFIQFLKDSTGLYEFNSEVLITTYLDHYRKILKC